MQTRSKKPCCIDRRAVEKGSRPSVANQAGVEKLDTSVGTSQTEPLTGTHNRESPNLGPAEKPPQNPSNQKKTRNKWKREDYKIVMSSFYEALDKPTNNITKQTYDIWRKKVGPDYKQYIDSNKLGNVRRDIVRSNRLTDVELAKIRKEATTEKDDISVEQACSVKAHRLEQDEIAALIEQVRTGQYVAKAPERNCNEGETQRTENSQEAEVSVNDNFSNANEKDIIDAKEDILRTLSVIDHTDLHDRKSLPKLQLNKEKQKIVRTYNAAMNKILQQCEVTLTYLNNLIYATALAVTSKVGLKPINKRKRHKAPAWKEKIQKEITAMRSELSVLEEFSRGTIVRTKQGRKVVRKYKLKDNDDIKEAKEVLKQKIQLKAQRIRRFEKRSNFYRQNKIFQTDAKRFYREIGKQSVEIKETPTLEKVQEFWQAIWSNPKEHNKDAEWLSREKLRMMDKEKQAWSNISIEEIEAALRKSHKWKSPGIDKIPNFWLNTLSSSHTHIANVLSEVVTNPSAAPEWLTEGITYLLPKNDETVNPKNYRPITCLSTTYKLLTSIITDRTYSFLENNDIFPIEQKGCKRGSYGCKDQLLVNKMILEICHRKKRNLSTAWIDYKKAFDSVPHTWILESLETYNISPVIVNFLKQSMKNWKTTLHLNSLNQDLTSSKIDINCGIFQGDSLSPLLFCLCLIPLSMELNRANLGYKISEKAISHLFYMDDLKLYAKNDNDLEGLLQIVKSYSDDICMEFGLDKCAKATFKRGKLVSTSHVQLDDNTRIKDLEQGEVYKYLGINEGDGIQHAAMKRKLRLEYYRRIRLVLRTELNSKNKITAINSLAVPVVQYSFNIINWTLEDIRRLDRKTRKFLTMHHMHHPKADSDRIYLPRSNGGRGLLQLESSFKTTTIGLQRYLEVTQDWMMQEVSRHESCKTGNSITKKASKFMRELDMNREADILEEDPTKAAKEVKHAAKKEILKKTQDNWEEKFLYGQYPLRANQADVDKQMTHQWLRSSGLKGETEGFILAAQDQCLLTRNYQANVLKNGANPNCRICDKALETVDHLVSGCSVLAPSEYLNRHDRVGKYIHWKLCKHYGIKTVKNWYEHNPDPVTEIGDITILWDFSIHTDRTIKANRPDIVIKNKTESERMCTLIDVAVPADHNVAIKEFEKKAKYKDLEIEIAKMWHMRTQVVPVIIGALGMIKKGTSDLIKQIPGSLDLNERQKITLNGTAHILRKTLSM